ncbi:alpha/beta hydrolase [Sphingomonas sp. RP10(2022)]|uniref:Alpha/beta hydrolase n=1 Tax=Sphingomonas liriopis TaxID=2949094 RepID=A0A9X2HLQ9_9SPHN|nr:alpha/beta hydrolase [Sphingomonas liriopis]MCP3733531.1 alpha/beta hydrolase [Sphingomonas liriopis]
MLAFSGMGLAAWAAAPFDAAQAAVTAAAAAPGYDPTPFVHPELRPFVPMLLKYKTGGTMNAQALPALRKMVGGAPRDPAARPVDLPPRAGAPAVRVYVLGETTRGGTRPAILHVHGGGYIAGSAASETGRLRTLAQALDAVIVTVEYRLSPETPFPGPLEDCYTALQWLFRNAADLGVDRRRIAVMGESAGGGLAAMLAIAARDRGEVPLLFQSLVYPMLDDRTGSTRRVAPPVGYLAWDEGANRFGWSSFLGRPAGGRTPPPGSVPARVERLAGLPPTFIGVGSIDLFVSENLDYARRLVEAAVPTELLLVPGAFHGFQAIAPKAGISVQFDTAIRNALANAFARTW